MKKSSIHLPNSPQRPLAFLRIHWGFLAVLLLFLGLAAARAIPVPSFIPTGSLVNARTGQTATLLNNGKVLVAGGANEFAFGMTSAELYDPATGTWTPTGDMNDGRAEASAVLLENGKVLVTGGYNDQVFWATAELYDPATGTWSRTGVMNASRVFHTSTRLPDGTVLVAGGFAGDYNESAETYDPATGVFTPTAAPLNFARAYHSATLLQDGTVLLAGGTNSDSRLAQTEIYNPQTRTFSSSGSMNAARDEHSATLLPDGRVLVAGGHDPGGFSLSSAEIYDPQSQTWSFVASMNFTHAEHEASLLPNGQVLIMGGRGDLATDGGGSNGSLAATELYDPANDSWDERGDLTMPVEEFTATLLPSGRVLVAGGNDDAIGPISNAEIYETGQSFFTLTSPMNVSRSGLGCSLLPDGTVLAFGGDDGETVWQSAEIYQPSTGNWSFTGDLNEARELTPATLLTDGTVLVAGGAGAEDVLSSTKIYYPALGRWFETTPMTTPRYYHTATLLRNGKVLVTGGTNNNGTLTSSEVYDNNGQFWQGSGDMLHPRYLHTATLLPNGKVLIVGGTDGTIIPSEAEIYDPDTGLFSSGGAMVQPRFEHTATLLPTGKVLVTGGLYNNAVVTSSELYDPATNSWTATGDLNTPRRFQSATLLQNGKVLVAGGKDASGNFLADGELYDPANGTWTSIGSQLPSGRELQKAVLLENGQVLFAGGLVTGNVQTAEADLYDEGLGFFSPDYQSTIESVTNPIQLTYSLQVSGAGFEGISEASGGNGPGNSPSNHPVVQIRSINNEDVKFLDVDELSGFDSGSFTSAALVGFTPGPALVTVFVNGIPSASYYTVVDVAAPTLTVAAPATGDVGQPLTATVTVSGGLNPTGQIYFAIYGPDAPSCDGLPVGFSTVSVDGDGTYESDPFTPPTAGGYHWVASYFGDDNNQVVTTECGADGSVTTVSAGLPTPTPTPTATPSATPTPSPTATPTATPSPTASPSPTVSPSPSPSATPEPAQAKNLSSRVSVGTNQSQAIGGFIITGTAEKMVILRGLGPSLAAQGVTGFLADPKIDLYNSDGQLIQSNDNWRDTQEVAIENTTLAPTSDKEAAIVATLRPGTYTFVLSGVGDASGVGLTEVYDLTDSALSRIGNLSTRGAVTTGESVVIAGFILSQQATDADIVIRGLGPSLAAFGVDGALPNPALELHDAQGNLLQSNNDWQDDPAQAALISGSGLAPSKPNEAAMEVSLPAGTYTAILKSQDGGTGVGLVEIYNK